MKKAKVVIGSAYGDEAKGVYTDYLSSQSEESLVIRFNGGAQAGHTVVTPKGQRHVFGHFGANSFLRNSKTVLSKFFVVNPLLFSKEKNVLNNLDVNPKVYIHKDAYITTPFEMFINQWQEEKRGNERHGSCGVGFGETIEREEVDLVVLRMADIFSDGFKDKLLKVRNRFFNRAKNLNLEECIDKFSFVESNSFIEKFLEDSRNIFRDVTVFDDLLPPSNNIVFEGAQGLLLDQSFGSFPHVTRSNTGLKNVVEIAKDYGIDFLDTFYVTRCYTTRHGNGPLKNELPEKPYEKIVDMTNIPNTYQGSLRFSYLDLSMLKNSIEMDISSTNLGKIKLNTSVGISCLDQTEIVKFYQDDALQSMSNRDFPSHVSKYFLTRVLESWGGSRKDVFSN